MIKRTADVHIFVKDPEFAARLAAQDVAPELSKRPALQDFYYVRIGRKQVQGVTGDDWTMEAIVFPDDCSMVKVQGKRGK